MRGSSPGSADHPLRARGPRLDLIVAAGFPRPDFRWPELRLVVEADGARWHDNPQARAEDAERQALLEAHGDRVVRVDWSQATRGAAATVARLSALGLPR